MPNPVSAARQCLTQEAASVLDDAVAVARRRGHAQTTSLHVVSSLLSLPRSSLREACARTTDNAYSTRVQFKALELCLSVSLDRLPSSQGNKVEEPPVANSLMAAIKRSQANQRRQPENFAFYQQQQQQYASCSSSIPVVKVELQNLILSILDDPLVSRVFGEAGFRSCDIKLATLRPGNNFHAPHMYGYSSRYKRSIPPLFLCNLKGSDSVSEVGSKGFSFPFMGCFSGDENSRRIGEIMLRDKKRCPLLLGASAGDALRSFLETVEKKIKGVLPEVLNGLSAVCMKEEILRYLNGDCDEGPLVLRFEEVERMVENVTGPGVVISFGDLKALAGDGVAIAGLRYLVSKLAKLVQDHRGKLWLIGAGAAHEVHSKILSKFPNIEEDWDLEILPITSLQFSMGGAYPRSSLMGSFVPLGGFFSMPSELPSPLSSACQYMARCHLCNEKYEQEVAAISIGGHCASVAERYQSSFPPWLQTAEPNAQGSLASIKGKDDTALLNAKIMGLQKKWDSICQQHHFNQAYSKGFTHQVGCQFPRVMGFQVVEDRKDMSFDHTNHSIESSNETGNKNASSSLSTDLRQGSSVRALSSLDTLSKANNQSISTKSGEIPSESKGEPGCPRSVHFKSLRASINDGLTSPNPVTSVITDLGLGITSACTSREPEKPVHQSHLNLVRDLSGSLSNNEDTFTRCISNYRPQASSCFNSDNIMLADVKGPKSLYEALVERVGQQEDAINTIIETMTRQTETTGLHGVSRRNIWINCQGPDRLGKKKLGVALAEMLYGSTESLVYVNLSSQDETTQTDIIFNSQVTNKYDPTMRKTVVDYLADKLSKKPSIVFLENIDEAIMLVRNSLSQAVKTGRFVDLRGREVTVSNCIFLATTRFLEGSRGIYSEEDILRAKGSLIQILIRFDLNDDPTNENSCQSDATRVGCSDLFLMNKRKLVGQSGSMEVTKRAYKASNSCLDLNLPAEGSEICSTFSSESDSDSSSENSRSWLEDFNRQIDQIVVFKPVDFERLAENLFKDMTKCLHNIVGSECSIEIEPKVMQQLLAAAYLFGHKRVEDWIQQVLGQGLVEAMGKFGLNVHSILRLVTCESTCSEEQPEGLLPAAIVLK